MAATEGDNHEDNTIAVGENGIISVLQSKTKKKRNSKSATPDSLTKPGTYYRVLNAYMADEKKPHVVILGPMEQWLLWIAANFST